MKAIYRALRESLPCRTVREDKLHGRLNHSYLVIAEDEEVRKKLGRELAKAALCPRGGCDECDVCAAINDKNHISLVFEKRDKLNVEDVENLVDNTFFTSGFGGDLKCYLIVNMQGMNERAQNKFLKTLEEPTGDVVFFLEAPNRQSVLDTIASRCKTLYFPGFEAETLTEILQEEVPRDPNVSDADRAETIERAAACAYGSYSKAKLLAEDGDFSRLFALVADILVKMTDSKKMDEQAARLAPYKNDVGKVLDMLETVLSLLVDRNGVKSQMIDALAQTFDRASVVNSLGLVAEAKRKIERNCNAQSVLDVLFLGILEVKYLCRR